MCIQYSYSSLFTFPTKKLLKRDMIISVVENHSNSKKKKKCIEWDLSVPRPVLKADWSNTTGINEIKSTDHLYQEHAVNSTMATDNDTTHPWQYTPPANVVGFTDEESEREHHLHCKVALLNSWFMFLLDPCLWRRVEARQSPNKCWLGLSALTYVCYTS